MNRHPPAGQTWSASGYRKHAAFVADLGQEVLDLLDPAAGEHILDLGCGDGGLTRKIASRGSKVTGLEPDTSMAEAARVHGLAVLEQDAHTPFGDSAFEAVFSNAALHWMRDPEQVIQNVHRALRPGGRFVAEQGGFGNVASVVTALSAALALQGHEVPNRSLWDFPRPEKQQSRLEEVGFEVTKIALIPRPTPLPTGMSGWLETFAAPYLAKVGPHAQADVLAQTEEFLHHHKDHSGVWWADYVRLRFSAIKVR
ncbi:MAG: class I SAM-dependent methyltransferase [Pseudomonadota bacterium]